MQHHHRDLQLTLMTTLRPLHRSAARAAALLLLTAAASTSVVTRAEAQPAETPGARADRLFREGKAALGANNFAEACPKLAESQRLDPGTGTLLALALCHEGAGQTATALREFRDVATASQKVRADRAALALKHVKALEPQLATLALTVPPSLQATVQIRVDGEEVPASAWANPLPLDPGDHPVEASAPGRVPWKSTVHLDATGGTKAVTVPDLEPVAAAPVVVAPPPDTSASHPMGTRRLAGWITGGAGVVVLGVGGVFGGLALSKQSSAKGLCPSSPCSSSAGVADNSAAKTDAWVADFGVGLGLVGLGTAAYLLFFAKDDAPPATAAARGLTVLPSVGAGGGGLSLRGAW